MHEDFEVKYWTKELGVSKDRAAVASLPGPPKSRGLSLTHVPDLASHLRQLCPHGFR
jgi:hypothetical protein